MPALPKLETWHNLGADTPLNQTLNQALNQDTRATLRAGARKANGTGFFIVLKKIFPPWGVMFEL
jgi:hypothetical protein